MKSFQPPSSTVDTSPSMTVVDLVARADDADPVALEPLYDAIDPDLLDGLADADGFSTLEFRYHGYTVRVTGGDDGIAVSLVDADVSADGSSGVSTDTESST
ncbi:HalOD1 output domain-containing protein [Haloarchaeobius amylolyticus]|uniref:HalOD1 output domain-containing protein n=1 Tax=Haloarchaeobius amylolyticus TaxID=1198296 RepID=A0ABD6BEM1_9EURY